MIFPDGTVKSGRPEHCVGAHAKGFNTYLGIVLIGDFSSKSNPTGDKALAKPTVEQMHALVSLTRQLRDRYNIPITRVVRHSDIAYTLCPGNRFPYDPPAVTRSRTWHIKCRGWFGMRRMKDASESNRQPEANATRSTR